MTVAESYAHCTRVAREQARNFYYAFLLLDPPRRQAMCAVYAFMRHCDDLSDAAGVGDRADALASWRAELDRALAGDTAGHPVWPAFADTAARYGIPSAYFHDMIDGVCSDLLPRRVQTFAELYRYCYQVASVVGLTIVHIFGFTDPRALALAEKCGIAFQLTNILRDVREDLEQDRVYLPAEDLTRFGVTPFERNAAFLEMMRFEADRAHEYYRESRPLLDLVTPSTRPALWALIEIYRRLLERIEESHFEVLATRVRVPTWEKLWILATAKFRA